MVDFIMVLSLSVLVERDLIRDPAAGGALLEPRRLACFVRGGMGGADLGVNAYLQLWKRQ
jgi:hypothetical protein